MDKTKVIIELGNLIMRDTLEKDDNRIVFEAYKLLSDYYSKELRERPIEYSEASCTKEEIDYQHWKDDYCKQMLWFYKTLGLEHVQVDGDFLVVDENGIFGYNLRRMYEQFKVSDEEQ